MAKSKKRVGVRKKPNPNKHNVVVLIPSRGLLISKMMESLLRELNNCSYIRKWEIVCSHDMTVDKARQYLAEEFVEREWADYSFWVDDDQVLSEGLLTRLFEAEADYASCHVVNRSPKNLMPNASMSNRQKSIFWFPPDNMRKDFETNDLTFISLAVSLIKRRVFEEIPKPWFKSELDENLPARYWEDGYFSEKILKYQRDKFKCVILPEFCPHWELTAMAGIKGTNTKFHSYFHSDKQHHEFRVYDGDTLFPQTDNESLIEGHNTPRGIEIADRFKG
tara:strand:- start:3860 stop:4693 length:834 start_codon:yes stop_codon:yes gene_type:complete